MELIRCTDLSIKYDGREAVENLTFSISKGDYLCIIGENGSGKSTVIKAILGLIKPDSGKIEYCGELSRNEIGYLPQQTNVQKDFPASVWEVVLTGCIPKRKIFPAYSSEDKNKARENMNLLGIAQISNRCYRELSGGQQQRVLLARALCAAKELILLDEPVSGLDPDASEEMYSIVEKLNKTKKTTVIMVSHDINAVKKYSSHVLHMQNSPIFFGNKKDYFENDASTFFPRSEYENNDFPGGEK